MLRRLSILRGGTIIMSKAKASRWHLLLFLALVVSVPIYAANSPTAATQGWASVNGWSTVNGNAFPFYNRQNPMKAVFEVPSDRKKWPTVALVLTHNLVSVMGHGVPIKVVLVAPGPTIYFFTKKYNPKGYAALKRLHDLGVKMVVCHAALIAFNEPKKDIFPFVGIARNSGVVYIIKKEAEGYSYYTWP